MSIQFKNVRFQWWKLLRRVSSLNDFDKVLAFHITAEYINSETNACWPSIDRLADDLGKDRRSVQRSLKRLEEQGFLGIVRYRGRNRTNTMFITEESLSLALQQKLLAENEENHDEIKGDKLDHKTRQYCHPNLINKSNSNNLIQADARDDFGFEDDIEREDSSSHHLLPSVRVEIESPQGRAWREHFQQHNIVEPQTSNSYGKGCWHLPSRWPPANKDAQRTEHNLIVQDQIEVLAASFDDSGTLEERV